MAWRFLCAPVWRRSADWEVGDTAGLEAASFANKAHARNVLAYGATITPFGGNGYYTTLLELERQTVNARFRTNTVYDGVIDFDAAVRDTVTLTNFQAAFCPGLNASDWLHMNPLGYQAMANAIDLNLFTQ